MKIGEGNTKHGNKYLARTFVEAANFCDTFGSANASANQFSLVETCKSNGVEVYRYLVALFKALPYAKTIDDYETLMPWRLASPAPTT